IGADLLIKATKVDGVYSADPVKHPDAKRFDTLSYQDALSRQLKVMDAAAFSLCMENDIPIVVFDFFKENGMVEVLTGKDSGTLVTH
ncbi:MAG: UMP kinase, partial [Pontiella sp.]|nr:UMP kinase [Pontiella sp.]